MFTLADVALAAEQPAPPGADELVMSAAHFDSRRIESGMLFVALPGARVDGHDYIRDAFSRGAAAILCARPDPDEPLSRQIVAMDALAAFERLAGALRSRSPATVIGITGSNGKTSTKEALAAALSAVGPDPRHRTQRERRGGGAGHPVAVGAHAPLRGRRNRRPGHGRDRPLLQLREAGRGRHYLRRRSAPGPVWLHGGHCRNPKGSSSTPSQQRGRPL